MDDRVLRRSPVRWASPVRQRSCGRHKFLPLPPQSRAASSETSAHTTPAASPRPIPDGERAPYPRIAWEKSFLVEDRTGETRAALRTQLSTPLAQRLGSRIKGRQSLAGRQTTAKQ